MISDFLRLPPGSVDLSALDTDVPDGFDGDKADGKHALAELGPQLADLQERLFAEGTTGSNRRVLLVLQGMDTSGKGGVMRHAVGLVDPQGIRIKSFKAPIDEELEHDFLWRIRKEVPEPGIIGVFDRSHYEDVLIARVRELAPPEEIERRYDTINSFEQELADEGVVIVKCFLHISAEQQKRRLLARLDKPEKHWKFHPADIDERRHWPAYQEAYRIVLERTATQHAPWFVIPSDTKWFRNLAVADLLHTTLEQMDPRWPQADFDVEKQRQRLLDERLEP